jgi:hypothetical protein
VKDYRSKKPKNKMIKHVVMWKLKDSAEGNDQSTNRGLIKEKLLELKQKIPQIDSMEVGYNFNTSAAAFDVVLITTHISKEALKEYAMHPEHQQVAGFIGKVVEDRKVVDFEY